MLRLGIVNDAIVHAISICINAKTYKYSACTHNTVQYSNNMFGYNCLCSVFDLDQLRCGHFWWKLLLAVLLVNFEEIQGNTSEKNIVKWHWKFLSVLSLACPTLEYHKEKCIHLIYGSGKINFLWFLKVFWINIII